MKRVVLLLALSGCDQLFGLEPVPTSMPDADLSGVCAHGFITHVDYPTSNAPTAIALGRIDANESLDVVVGHADGKLEIYLNAGNGQLGAPSTITFPQFGAIVGIAIGRLGADMNSDIVVTVPSAFQIHILSGAGDGTFSDTPMLLGGWPYGVALARLLGSDGLLDIAVARRDMNSMWFGQMNAAGAVELAMEAPTGMGPTNTIVGDFDRDSIPDVATVNIGDGSVTALFSGDTTPAIDVRSYDVGFSPHGLVAGQLVGDANIDFVTSITGNMLEVLRGGEIPRTYIGEAGPQISGTSMSQLAAGELTGGPGVDLAVANQAAATVTVMASPLGSARDDLAVGQDPVAIAVGDLDGDMHDDIVTANGVNTVSVLRSCAP